MSAPAVVIPTLNAGPMLGKLLQRLQQQSLAPAEILVIDSASTDGTPALAAQCGARVVPIQRKDFNHGGTRNFGLRETTSEVVCFLTQDAIPANNDFLANLCKPLSEGRAAAVFARQIPHTEAWPPERLARAWNYPGEDEWRHRDEQERWGLRYVFFSNVASAVRRDRFEAIGGFPSQVIMNEDVVLSARLLEAGDTIGYTATAVVNHSHNYSIGQQFRRYFDIGVFHARHADLIPKVGVGGEGRRFLTRQLLGLLKGGHGEWIPRTLLETAAKYLAFQLGKREHHLGKSLKRRLSMHRGYWQ